MVCLEAQKVVHLPEVEREATRGERQAAFPEASPADLSAGTQAADCRAAPVAAKSSREAWRVGASFREVLFPAEREELPAARTEGPFREGTQEAR